MKQTLYQTVAPKPDDDSFLLQIKERGKEFVVTQIRYHYDSKSGIQESTVKTITGQHPFMKRSEAMQVYESHRRTLAAKGYKHAFSRAGTAGDDRQLNSLGDAMHHDYEHATAITQCRWWDLVAFEVRVRLLLGAAAVLY